MPNTHAWSQDAPADIVDVVEAIIAASSVTADVFDGRATPGAVPPFVTCWQLDPLPVAVGLAAEDWGQSHAQWQISPHGVTQGQARYLLGTDHRLHVADRVGVGRGWPAHQRHNRQTGDMVLAGHVRVPTTV